MLSRSALLLPLIVITPTTNHSIIQSITQSINRSTNQSTNSSINQSIDQPINQPINQSITQSVNHNSSVYAGNLKKADVNVQNTLRLEKHMAIDSLQSSTRFKLKVALIPWQFYQLARLLPLKITEHLITQTPFNLQVLCNGSYNSPSENIYSSKTILFSHISFQKSNKSHL